MPTTESIAWRGHDATRIGNDLVELIALTEGGHLAEYRFLDGSGLPTQNVLWEAPWMRRLSSSGRAGEREETGGFTGHALCLDYFGVPSPEEAEKGLPIHGEAATMRWDVSETVHAGTPGCRSRVDLPHSQLRFERMINLRDHESVVRVEETVRNLRDRDHSCHWVQHVTLSPPFLAAEEGSLMVTATRGITAPSAYEGGSLLAIDREFTWPFAPDARGRQQTVDLQQPFSVKGRGCLAAVQLDPRRSLEFLLAMNWKLRLGVGYCLRQSDFPWMAVWEENCTRREAPWNGNTQARGMEFGTTPLPLGRNETQRRGNLFDMATSCVIPALGSRTARYIVFLFGIPSAVNSIQDASLEDDRIVLNTDDGGFFSIPASGCQDFLAMK